MRKGVSPLIASVMLIAITVSLAILIMGWFGNLTKSTTDTVANRTTETVSCTSARVSIESVYLSPGTAGSARIIVKNGDSRPIGINSVQLYNRTGNNFSTGFSTGTLDAGAIYTVYLTGVSVPSCPADFSKALVTSSCGGVSATFDGAPNCV